MNMNPMPETTETKPEHGRWMIVEIMGHRRYGALVRSVSPYGVPMLECEIPGEPPWSQLVAPSAIFALTPCTEAQARSAATSWGAHRPPELPGADRTLSARTRTSDDDDDGDDDGCVDCGVLFGEHVERVILEDSTEVCGPCAVKRERAHGITYGADRELRELALEIPF